MEYVKNLDLLWMMSHASGIVTPMWVGFNARINRTDNQIKQKVFYLTPINEAPTDNSVVLETMRRALRIADECGEQYAQVTYDLGIARIALQLQNTEFREFQKLFIHIQMSYFKAIRNFFIIKKYLLSSQFMPPKIIYIIIYYYKHFIKYVQALNIISNEISVDYLIMFGVNN